VAGTYRYLTEEHVGSAAKDFFLENEMHPGRVGSVLRVLGGNTPTIEWEFSGLVALYTLAMRYASGQWQLTDKIPADIRRGLVSSPFT
jgi:hypothetical protein